MKKILSIHSSAGGVNSTSTQLGNAICAQLLGNFKGSTVSTRDLSKHPFPHVDEQHVTSFFTPPEYRTEELKAVLKFSDEGIGELIASDIIVISLPMYNFSIPSTLKAWIDHIVRVGLTFNFTATGTEALVHGKKVYLAISTGGIYTEGPRKQYDYTEVYLKDILGFIGLTDVTVFRVEGTAIPGMKETALQQAIDKIAIAEVVVEAPVLQ